MGKRKRVKKKILPERWAHVNDVTWQDFYACLPTNTFIYRRLREHWTATAVDRQLPPIQVKNKGGKEVLVKASQWLGKNRYANQLTWAPGRDELVEDQHVQEGGWFESPGARTYNLYRPPTIEHGDPTKAGRWREHLMLLFSDEDVEHIINWCAHRVQFPEEKINHGLLLVGDQGIGKDTALAPVRAAVGPWNIQSVRPQDVMARFNGYIKSVILEIQEARDQGGESDSGSGVNRYSFYEHLKVLTATPPDGLRCNEKHLREYYVPNVCGVIVLTNHDDGLYLPEDDRRFYVARSEQHWDIEEKRRFGERYFPPLYQWFETEGNSHVAAYLAHVDLTDFNAKAPPPRTPGWFQVMHAGQSPELIEISEALDAVEAPRVTEQLRGAAAQAPSAWPLAVTWKQLELTGRLPEHVRGRPRAVPHRMREAGYVPQPNPGAKDGCYKVNGNRQMVYVRKELAPAQRAAAAEKLGAG
jgi:hypothetical protein